MNLEKLYPNDKSTDSVDVPSPGSQNKSDYSPNKKQKLDHSSDIDDNSQSSNQVRNIVRKN